MPVPAQLTCLFLLGGLILSAEVARGQELEDVFEPQDAPWLSQEFPIEAERVEEPLETDRDSFTPATTTVESGRVLFESAYSFIDNRNTADTHSFPEFVARAGITERLEFRLGSNYEVGGGGSISGGDAGGSLEELGSRQESQVLYGFKYSLTKQQDWVPQTACIVQATTPTSGPETFSDMQLGYVFGWKVFDDWQLDSSIRYIATKEEGDHFNDWAPSVVLKIPVAKQWNVHGEYFGIFTDGRSESLNQQYFSPGVHYLISPNCEFGVRLGWGLNQDAARFFTNVGFGLQI